MASKRTPALSTQLKAAQAEVEALKKKLTDAEKYKDCYLHRMTEAENELDGIHDVLDTLADAPARKLNDGYNTRKVSVRLAGYFAAAASRRGA